MMRGIGPQAQGGGAANCNYDGQAAAGSDEICLQTCEIWL